MNRQFSKVFYRLHTDANVNFQLNRCITWAGDGVVDPLTAAAKRIHDYHDWKRELLALGKGAEKAGQCETAAYYFRAAEFFMSPGDPDKEVTYTHFIDLMDMAYPMYARARTLVPFEGSQLPAWRLGAGGLKGTILFHGGFDSFIEETYPVFWNSWTEDFS